MKPVDVARSGFSVKRLSKSLTHSINQSINQPLPIPCRTLCEIVTCRWTLRGRVEEKSKMEKMMRQRRGKPRNSTVLRAHVLTYLLYLLALLWLKFEKTSRWGCTHIDRRAQHYCHSLYLPLRFFTYIHTYLRSCFVMIKRNDLGIFPRWNYQQSYASAVSFTVSRRPTLLVCEWHQLNETPERERRLHDDRLAAVQTTETDFIETRQSQQPGRVAVLIDRVHLVASISGRQIGAMLSVELFAVHTLDSFIVVDVNTESPAPGSVVVHHLGNKINISSTSGPHFYNIQQRGLRDACFICVQ